MDEGRRVRSSVALYAHPRIVELRRTATKIIQRGTAAPTMATFFPMALLAVANVGADEMAKEWAAFKAVCTGRASKHPTGRL